MPTVDNNLVFCLLLTIYDLRGFNVKHAKKLFAGFRENPHLNLA